jgi:hypothetical protein
VSDGEIPCSRGSPGSRAHLHRFDLVVAIAQLGLQRPVDVGDVTRTAQVLPAHFAQLRRSSHSARSVAARTHCRSSSSSWIRRWPDRNTARASLGFAFGSNFSIVSVQACARARVGIMAQQHPLRPREQKERLRIRTNISAGPVIFVTCCMNSVVDGPLGSGSGSGSDASSAIPAQPGLWQRSVAQFKDQRPKIDQRYMLSYTHHHYIGSVASLLSCSCRQWWHHQVHHAWVSSTRGAGPAQGFCLSQGEEALNSKDALNILKSASAKRRLSTTMVGPLLVILCSAKNSTGRPHSWPHSAPGPCRIRRVYVAIRFDQIGRESILGAAPRLRHKIRSR